MFRIQMKYKISKSSKCVGAYSVSISKVDETEENSFQVGPVYNDVRIDVSLRDTAEKAVNYIMDYINNPCEICIKESYNNFDYIFICGIGRIPKPEYWEKITVLARISPHGRWVSAKGLEKLAKI